MSTINDLVKPKDTSSIVSITLKKSTLDKLNKFTKETQKNFPGQKNISRSSLADGIISQYLQNWNPTNDD